MSETEMKQEVELEENVITKDAVASEPTHLKNDAEDLGAPVVKPTDTNPDGSKKVKKVKDQVNKDENDGSLPNDLKPSSVKEEEVEVEGDEVIAESDESEETEIDLSADVLSLIHI